MVIGAILLPFILEVLGIVKTRNQKATEYEAKYNDIPRDDRMRLAYLYDKLNLNPNIASQILYERDMAMQILCYNEIKIILYEEPEGSPRPRFRLVNRYNLANQALSNSSFVHVYSITGQADSKFMRRLITESDFLSIQGLIYTPCDILIEIFKPTPSYFNRIDTVLAEVGLKRPTNKPDWDNAGKKYSDMFNANVWLDDNLVIDGTVRKFYSILPRVEITLNYMNMLYNKAQAEAIARMAGAPSEIHYLNHDKEDIYYG